MRANPWFTQVWRRFACDVSVCFQTTVHLVITGVPSASQIHTNRPTHTHTNQNGHGILMTSSYPLRRTGKRGEDKELERKNI